MDYLLGIDIGSTSFKAIIYDLQGNAIAKASEPTQKFNPYPEHPDWIIWKPKQIWSGIANSIKEVTSQIDNPKDIKGLAVTGMGMDGVPIDKNGNWLYPFISWHCPRTIPQQTWWLENIGPDKQFSLGGNQIWTFNTALRLRWMKENEPQILKAAEKWLLIEDFINFMLCGEYATDYSMASTTLLFDQRKRQWSDELIELAQIDKNLLCEPKPSGTVLGQVHKKAAEATGLAEGTTVVLGGHDYLFGCLPTGAFKPSVVLDVTGTWEIVVATLAEPVLTPEIRKTGMLVDSHVAKDAWAVMGATVAADMLEWFKNQFCCKEEQKAKAQGGTVWDYLMSDAANSPAGTNGIMFLPHMSGCHCPILDHNSTGAFMGLRNTATKADMLRAIIEGLDYQFLQMVNAFESGLGTKTERIVAVGGATKNKFWMQNKADVVGRPIEAPDIDEAVPLGVAILAGIGVGLYRDEQDAYEQVYKPGQVYEPDKKLNSKYTEWFETFEKIYPALKDIRGES